MIPAQDSQGFPVNTLVKVAFDPHPLFFRILAVDHSRNSLQVRHVKCNARMLISSRIRCSSASWPSTKPANF